MSRPQNARRSQRRSQRSHGNRDQRGVSQLRNHARQMLEKFRGLAREAAASGDHIQAENYFQHAEHYQRLLNELQSAERNRENKARRDRDAPAAQPAADAEAAAEHGGNGAEPPAKADTARLDTGKAEEPAAKAEAAEETPRENGAGAASQRRRSRRKAAAPTAADGGGEEDLRDRPAPKRRRRTETAAPMAAEPPAKESGALHAPTPEADQPSS